MQQSMLLSKLPSQTASDSGVRSDHDLLTCVAAGDRRAMEVLYARHRVRLYRFLLRLVGNAANAEDLTSEVFLDVWRQACRFEGRSGVSTWMFAIARHKAMSALRRRADEQLDEETVAEIPDSADDAEGALMEQDRAAALRRCLLGLSPTHREVIDLVYYHGKSIAEVAEIIGALQNTVKTRMFYARKQLGQLLAAQGCSAVA